MSPTILIECVDATVRRVPGGEIVFPALNITIREGEAWAIVGPNGSGKTTLAETLAGKHRVSDGLANWPIANGFVSPSAVVSMVGFREESRAFSYRGKYYQQRYEFVSGDEDELTLRRYLGEPVDDVMVTRFDLRHVVDKPFVTLSNGQTRKARIIKALSRKPRMLILDDPFVGLDATARIELSAMLGLLHRDGMAIVVICQPALIPSWVTHQYELDDHRQLTVSPADGHQDTIDSPHDDTVIIQLSNVSVRHGSVSLLRNLSWTVRRGECWAIVGRNGSGKTTLLSLLCGDHPQAFSQDVSLFGQRRGSGESIWDVKARVGLISPELHLYFTEPLTARQTIASGFTDTMTASRITSEWGHDIVQIADSLQFTKLLDRPFGHLSSGEQRLILLARSLVKRPELLIWDEPFQCLDESAVIRVKRYLDHHITPNQTLLFVTHEPEELPDRFTRTLLLS